MPTTSNSGSSNKQYPHPTSPPPNTNTKMSPHPTSPPVSRAHQNSHDDTASDNLNRLRKIMKASRAAERSDKGTASIRIRPQETEEKEVDFTIGPQPMETIDVKVQLNIHRVGEIDSVKGTAMVKLELSLFWEDRRFANTAVKSKHQARVPGDLWGPYLRLDGKSNDLVMDQVLFVHAGSGHMMRTVLYEGTITNPMDLDGFPFDVDDIEIVFLETDNWSPKDFSFFSQKDNQPYQLIKYSEDYSVGTQFDRAGIVEWTHLTTGKNFLVSSFARSVLTEQR